MNRVRGLLQQALDDVLYPLGVRVYWGRKIDTGDTDADEYVVYTISGIYPEEHAANRVTLKSAEVEINYYHRAGLAETSAGRNRIAARENLIIGALGSIGLHNIRGPADIGDVDNIGFPVSLFEAAYWRGV